jgi:type III secretion system chaperone SycN
MDAIRETLRRFGDSVGLAALDFNAQNVSALDIESLGTLRFERIADQVFLCLSRKFPPHDLELAERALGVVGLDKGRPFSVRPALHEENTLLLTIRLNEKEFTLPNLERGLSLLGELMNTVELSA